MCDRWKPCSGKQAGQKREEKHYSRVSREPDKFASGHRGRVSILCTAFQTTGKRLLTIVAWPSPTSHAGWPEHSLAPRPLFDNSTGRMLPSCLIRWSLEGLRLDVEHTRIGRCRQRQAGGVNRHGNRVGAMSGGESSRAA